MNKDSRILVTGGCGFVGTHLIRELKLQGYQNVVSVGRTKGDYKCNLFHLREVRDLFLLTKPNVVIHAAAVVGGIGANKKTPANFFFHNLMMGANVVDMCDGFKVDKLVFLSTVCSYPKFCPVPFQEKDQLLGEPEETNAAYGWAKRSIQKMIEAYRHQYALTGITLLPTNMYGPGETNLDLVKSHVIPALILKILHAKKNNLDLSVWGTGNASREFLYVEDAVKAIILAMEQYRDIEPINIGNGQEYTIRYLVDLLCELLDFKGTVLYNTNKPDGQPRRCLDITKIMKLGFKPTTSLKDGLIKTISWIQEMEAKNEISI